MSDRLNVGAVDSWTTLNIQAVKHVPGLRSSMAVDLVLHPWHRGIEPIQFSHSVVKYIQKERSENRKVLSFIESLVLKMVLYEASHVTYWQLPLPK